MSDPTDVRIDWEVKISLRDGVHLSAILYRPEGQAEPAPAIFAMTPYVAQSHHEPAMYFARHGLCFLSVDVRGRGNAGGTFHPLNDSQDGHDVVEWISQQSYCNGRVAMWGGSYLGRAQWAVAKLRPLHLATIIPAAAPYYGVDVPLRNNVFATYTVRWLSILAGRTLQDKMFADQAFWSARFKRAFIGGIALKQLDEFLGYPSGMFQEWLAHPHLDDYWDRYNPTPEQYSQLKIPILTVTGAYDGDQPGALQHYREYMKRASAEGRARHYLIIGPWDHAGTGTPNAEFGGLKLGPASVLDMRKLQLDWYRWTMQDGPRPEFLRKSVAYYVIGAEKWRYADSLDAITASSRTLYLTSHSNPSDVYASGSLEALPQEHATADSYKYDPRDTAHADLESEIDSQSVVDQRMVHARAGRQLIYHSAPFEADTEVSGFFRLSLWLAIDQPDTDIRVAIYDVALDGSAVRLTIDWIRARYRQSFREPKLIDTPAPLRYDFERFTFISRLIGQGHRLRLVIGPIDSIHWQKNFNSGGSVTEETMADARVVTVRLFHDSDHPSALYVPLGHADSNEA